jgi:hypothetical protein
LLFWRSEKPACLVNNMALLMIMSVVATMADIAHMNDGISCEDISSTSLRVLWRMASSHRASPTDLLYVAFSARPSAPPFLIKTSTTTNITVQDLLPSTKYWIRYRSHPVDAPSLGWAWNDYIGANFSCTTKGTGPEQPHSLRRVGSLSDTSISLRWEHPASDLESQFAFSSVLWFKAKDDEVSCNQRTVGKLSGLPMSSILVNGTLNSVTLRQLDSASSYCVAVQLQRRSDFVLFKTGTPSAAHHSSAKGATKSRFTAMYRVSEFTNDVDFLDNHDQATMAALAVLLVRQASRFSVSDDCLADLAKLCPAVRGQGSECTACVQKHAQVGNVPSCDGNQDDLQSVNTSQDKYYRPKYSRLAYGSSDGKPASPSAFRRNFFCGVGWPSFSMLQSPITEYCVESLPVPPSARLKLRRSDALMDGLSVAHTAEDGNVEGGLVEGGLVEDDGSWAEYVSCDAPEAGAINRPSNPVCICWVAWDRVAVSNQPAPAFNKACGSSLRDQCNCTHNSINVSNSSTSAHYVGKSAVYLPYCYFTHPAASYPNHTHIGDNLSTPTKGKCNEGQALGDGGCTWKKQPVSRILYFDDLQRAGWNNTVPHDTPADMSGSLHAMNAMSRAWDGQDSKFAKLLSPRCCGC